MYLLRCYNRPEFRLHFLFVFVYENYKTRYLGKVQRNPVCVMPIIHVLLDIRSGMSCRACITCIQERF